MSEALPDELAALLKWIPDQAERERLTRAYYYVADGDPNSFPVQFALFSRGIALAQVMAMQAHTAALANSVDTVDQAYKQLDAIHTAAAKIELAAVKAEQVRFNNLLFSLGIAFVAGALFGMFFLSWIRH